MVARRPLTLVSGNILELPDDDDLIGQAPLLTPTGVKTSSYTAVAGDLVLVDASGGLVTITLPSASPAGQVVGIKKVDTSTNLAVLQRAGSDTIGVAPSTTIACIRSEVTHLVQSDGAGNWKLIGSVVADLRAVVTTKGDLLAASGLYTPGRLAVGSDGQILVADSAETLGLRWAGTIESARLPLVLGTVTATTGVSGSVSTDASSGGNNRNVTATGDVTINEPTNGSDGQVLQWTILASGAQRTVTFHANNDRLTGVNSSYAVPSGKVLRFSHRYTGLLSGWIVEAAAVSQ